MGEGQRSVRAQRGRPRTRRTTTPSRDSALKTQRKSGVATRRSQPPPRLTHSSKEKRSRSRKPHLGVRKSPWNELASPSCARAPTQQRESRARAHARAPRVESSGSSVEFQTPASVRRVESAHAPACQAATHTLRRLCTMRSRPAPLTLRATHRSSKTPARCSSRLCNGTESRRARHGSSVGTSTGALPLRRTQNNFTHDFCVSSFSWVQMAAARAAAAAPRWLLLAWLLAAAAAPEGHDKLYTVDKALEPRAAALALRSAASVRAGACVRARTGSAVASHCSRTLCWCACVFVRIGRTSC